MKTLNVKKVALVVAGAVLLGSSLAFAGGISYQNVPIVNNAGQPVVQVVLGSQSKPSDGLVAANIAAAIGNLAYTSVPVTATVNQTQAKKVLTVVGSPSGYTLKNPEVYLNESSQVGSSSTSYVFSALIGSVLNGAIVLNSPQSTKTLQGSSTQYAFPETPSIDQSPMASPYSSQNYIPIQTTVTPSNNGGGASFTSFSTGSESNVYDNVMQISNAQLPTLLNDWGAHSESTYLWLSGFPVFNQGASGSLVNQFQVLDTSGAYQATFGTSIQTRSSSNSPIINVPIKLLGQNWTIVRANAPTGSVPSSTAIAGGSISLATSLSQTVTVGVGKNYSIGAWNIALQDLGQPNSNGTSSAAVAIYYNNTLTNISSIQPMRTVEFNVSGHTLFVGLNQTFAGLYAYQKWAKFQLYTNLYNITNSKVFNATTNPGWVTTLLWTNTTGGTSPTALQSIIIYNTTPVTLSKGQNFSFIQNPSAYKVIFLGDTLGAGGFDTVNLQSSSSGNLDYNNTPQTQSNGVGNINNITEPTQELIVTSQIPNAFSYGGQSSSSVTYDLTPYRLIEKKSVLNPLTTTVTITGSGATLPWINPSGGAPLFATVTGYTQNGIGSPINQQVNLATGSNNTAKPFYNITNIKLSRAIPGVIAIAATTTNSFYSSGTGAVLATLQNTTSPEILYQQSGQQYESLISSSVLYNQQNGQPTSTFTLIEPLAPTYTSGSNVGQYFTYQIAEQGIPSDSTAVDSYTIGIDNNSAGVMANPLFQLNYSKPTGSSGAGVRNNVTYSPTSGSNPFNVQQGFVSEKGSKVNAMSPYSVSFNLAKSIDTLRFSVGQNTLVSTSHSTSGPYTIGQATNIANISVSDIVANVTGGTTSYSVSGMGNLTATPSLLVASEPVLLKNLSTQPLVVLDSQASPNENLIIVGSGYVNSLAQALQKQYNVSITNTTQPIVAAYGSSKVLVAGFTAAQTQVAGNSFIQQLYAQVH